MTDLPLISVYITSFNNQEFLPECLGSVFQQDYPNIEVMIGDDASENFDLETIQSWIRSNRTKNIKNIQIEHYEKNRGTVANIEHLVKHCSGEYLFGIAADDCFYNGTVLSRAYEAILKTEPGNEIVYGQKEYRNEDLSKSLGLFYSTEYIARMREFSPDEAFEELAQYTFYPPNSLVKKALYQMVGNLSDTYRYLEDWPMQLRWNRLGIHPTFVDEEPFVIYRRGGISTEHTRVSDEAFARFKLDSILVYENEVQPYLKRLSEKAKRVAIEVQTDREVNYYLKTFPRVYGNPFFAKPTEFLSEERIRIACRKWCQMKAPLFRREFCTKYNAFFLVSLVCFAFLLALLIPGSHNTYSDFHQKFLMISGVIFIAVSFVSCVVYFIYRNKES